MVKKFSVIFGAEEADRRLPFNDDKAKMAKIFRHKALRVLSSLATRRPLPKNDICNAWFGCV